MAQCKSTSKSLIYFVGICLIRMKFCMKIPFYVLFLVSIKSVNTVTIFYKNDNFYNFSQIVLLNAVLKLVN